MPRKKSKKNRRKEARRKAREGASASTDASNQNIATRPTPTSREDVNLTNLENLLKDCSEWKTYFPRVKESASPDNVNFVRAYTMALQALSAVVPVNEATDYAANIMINAYMCDPRAVAMCFRLELPTIMSLVVKIVTAGFNALVNEVVEALMRAAGSGVIADMLKLMLHQITGDGSSTKNLTILRTCRNSLSRTVKDLNPLDRSGNNVLSTNMLRQHLDRAWFKIQEADLLVKCGKSPVALECLRSAATLVDTKFLGYIALYRSVCLIQDDGIETEEYNKNNLEQDLEKLVKGMHSETREWPDSCLRLAILKFQKGNLEEANALRKQWKEAKHRCSYIFGPFALEAKQTDDLAMRVFGDSASECATFSCVKSTAHSSEKDNNGTEAGVDDLSKYNLVCSLASDEVEPMPPWPKSKQTQINDRMRQRLKYFFETSRKKHKVSTPKTFISWWMSASNDEKSKWLNRAFPGIKNQSVFPLSADSSSKDLVFDINIQYLCMDNCDCPDSDTARKAHGAPSRLLHHLYRRTYFPEAELQSDLVFAGKMYSNGLLLDKYVNFLYSPNDQGEDGFENYELLDMKAVMKNKKFSQMVYAAESPPYLGNVMAAARTRSVVWIRIGVILTDIFSEEILKDNVSNLNSVQRLLGCAVCGSRALEVCFLCEAHFWCSMSCNKREHPPHSVSCHGSPHRVCDVRERTLSEVVKTDAFLRD